jgi:putative ubiquitin-RnfH superfamily antitoxin RatB of RatAB toxin-antitoxin module
MARAEADLRIELAWSPAPREVRTLALVLPPGSTVADALRASGWLEAHGLSLESLRCGIWGRVQTPEHALRDGDRIELYRPLIVDPKEARRLRYKKQGRRKAPASAEKPVN